MFMIIAINKLKYYKKSLKYYYQLPKVQLLHSLGLYSDLTNLLLYLILQLDLLNNFMELQQVQ